MQFRSAFTLLLLLVAMPAAAQVEALRVVGIDAVSATHSLTPDGIDVLRVSVQNTTDSPSQSVEVRCRLGALTLSGREPSVPPHETTTLTLRLPRASRMQIPGGGTFARCSLVGTRSPEVTTMVYTAPALVPNLRFGGAGIEVRDCENFEIPTAGRPACVFIDPENTAQTVGPIGEVRVTTRCELGTSRLEDVRALRDLPTGEALARTAGEAQPVMQLGPLVRGTHLLSCVVDAARAIAESDERDNLIRLRVEVESATPRRYDVAIAGLSARYAPWRGHEYPQPDQVVLRVDLVNRGDALILGGQVECVIGGSPQVARFGGLPPPRGYARGARFFTYISLPLAEGERPPRHLDASCRVRLEAPRSGTDADASNDAEAGRIAVEH